MFLEHVKSLLSLGLILIRFSSPPVFCYRSLLFLLNFICEHVMKLLFSQKFTRVMKYKTNIVVVGEQERVRYPGTPPFLLLLSFGQDLLMCICRTTSMVVLFFHPLFRKVESFSSIVPCLKLRTYYVSQFREI